MKKIKKNNDLIVAEQETKQQQNQNMEIKSK